MSETTNSATVPLPGTLYGVGIGPGDPDLITLKGYRVISECAVIAYPAPETGPSLARSIVDAHIPAGRIEVVIRMPMVAARFPAQEVYDRASVELGEHLAAGRDVAVLCEGDPFFYGSFMYLFARMSPVHRVEVIPGVSSLTACAAALGAPLASRDDVLVVVPATLPHAELCARMAGADTIAVIKVGRHLEKLRQVLRELDLLTQAHYIEHATMAAEHQVPLELISNEQAAPYFSMVLVHRRGHAWL